MIDEPEEAGGNDQGPSPTRTLAAALAACTAITTEMYAERKGWELGDVEVEVEMEYGEPARAALVRGHPAPPAAGSPRSRSSASRVIAGKCPVHRVLATRREVTITDRVELV